MTISSITNRASFTGNGVTTSFSFPYSVIAAADLKVYLNGTLQTITTDYTLSGSAPYTSGTNVQFVSAPAADDEIVVIRDPAITQAVDLVDNDPFDPDTSVEQPLDKLTMIAQRLKDRLDRAMVLSDGEAGSPDMTLPSLEDRASMALHFNALGEPIAADVSAATVTFSPDIQLFSGDGSDTTFTLAEAPGSAAALIVSISGVLQKPGTDFTVSGTTLTFTSAPASGTDNIAVQNFGIARAVTTNDADGVTYTPNGSGAVNRDVQTKLREFVSVKDFGAAADGVTDDTAAITAAIATGKHLYFPDGLYAVTSVTFGNEYQSITMANNAWFYGIANAATKAVVEITAREQAFYGLHVTSNFNTNYTCGLQIASNGALTPAHLHIIDLHIQQLLIGLLYGDTTSPIDAAVSENTIAGFRTLFLHRPIYCNQPNGFLTINGGVLNCNQGNWGATAWAAAGGDTAAAAIDNRQGVITTSNVAYVKNSASSGSGTCVNNRGLSTNVHAAVVNILGGQVEISVPFAYTGENSFTRIDGLFCNYWTSGSGTDHFLTCEDTGNPVTIQVSNLTYQRASGNENSVSGLIDTNTNPNISANFDNIVMLQQLDLAALNSSAYPEFFFGNISIQNSLIKTESSLTSCGTTSGSATVTYTGSAVAVGDSVIGAGIPVGAQVVSVSAGVSFTLDSDHKATATATVDLTGIKLRNLSMSPSNLAVLNRRAVIGNWNVSHTGGSSDPAYAAVTHPYFSKALEFVNAAGGSSTASTKVTTDTSIRAGNNTMLTLDFWMRVTAAAVSFNGSVYAFFFDDDGNSIGQQNIATGPTVGPMLAIAGAQPWTRIKTLISPPVKCAEIQISFSTQTTASTMQMGGFMVY